MPIALFNESAGSDMLKTSGRARGARVSGKSRSFDAWITEIKKHRKWALGHHALVWCPFEREKRELTLLIQLQLLVPVAYALLNQPRHE